MPFATANDLRRNVDSWIENIDINRKEGESPTAYGERGKTQIQNVHQFHTQKTSILSPVTYLVSRRKYRELDEKMKNLEAEEFAETATTYNKAII